MFREAEATPHEADLMAAVEALKALNRPCAVEIIGCSYLSSAEQWLSRWRENGWKNVKGQEIAHKDLWQKYNGQILRHRVKFGISGSFSGWLETEIRKKKEKIGG